MNYEITPEQLDRLMKPYWDEKFAGAEFYTMGDYADGEDWTGLYRGDNLLIGYPKRTAGFIWFSNGEYFDGGWKMFSIPPPIFNLSMKRYIWKKFGIDVPNIN